MAEREHMVGNFQCPRCHIASMQGWSGYEYPKEEDCPQCCYGVRMEPYRIISATTPSAIPSSTSKEK